MGRASRTPEPADDIGKRFARIAAIAIGGSLICLEVWRQFAPAVDHLGDIVAEGSNTRGQESPVPEGRDASSPTEIPAKGWKDILLRTYGEISEDRIVAVAAGVTFYALLAVFPAIAAFVSLYGLIADRATLNDHLVVLDGILPPGGFDIVREQLTRLTAQNQGALGFGFLFSFGLALWSANAGIKALFDALNVAYDEDEKRSFLKLNLMSLAFTAGSILFLLAGLVAIVVVPIALDMIGMRSTGEAWLAMLRWPAMLLIAGLAVSLLYRYGPSRESAQWRWITPGGVLAATLWLITSLGFSWYVANFGSYNETYSTLGAAIGFMTWIWISSVILLAGAELNAEAEHQTTGDTTTGNPQPLGLRGATVADTVA